MSLFGASKPNAFGQTSTQPGQQQPATGFGTFGQPQSTQPTAPASGSGFGLFGAASSNNAAQTNAGTTNPSPFSAFGSLTSQQSQPQQQQPAQASPFGAFGGNQNNNNAATNTQAPGTSSQPSLFSGFGASTANQNTAQQSQPQAQQSSIFGGGFQSQPQSQSQAGSSAFSGSLFGGQQSQQSGTGGFGLGASTQQNPAAQFGQSQLSNSVSSTLTKSSKFNDLPDNIKRVLEQVDSVVQRSVQTSTELKASKYGQDIEKATKLLGDLAPTVQGISNIIQSDEEITQDLKVKLDQATQDETIATQIIDGFRDQTKSISLQTYANFPLEYYTRLTHQLINRLTIYKNTVDAIERKLASLTEPHPRSPQAISSTLRAQHTTFMALASRTAELDAAMKKIRQVATAAWRAQTGSALDPFEARARLGNSVSV